MNLFSENICEFFSRIAHHDDSSVLTNFTAKVGETRKQKKRTRKTMFNYWLVSYLAFPVSPLQSIHWFIVK